ncbi:hypothetical protein [Aquifex sp.]
MSLWNEYNIIEALKQLEKIGLFRRIDNIRETYKNLVRDFSEYGEKSPGEVIIPPLIVRNVYDSFAYNELFFRISRKALANLVNRFGADGVLGMILNGLKSNIRADNYHVAYVEDSEDTEVIYIWVQIKGRK